ncbi:DUF2959 family protein [candidate division WS5 bacterium]|uniref:DUF2959 family protein n=1 Tax=candidate division WS5 bacterium TaxID=2093353 RepID=A0A419DAN4_9BACT|nr:MAG: DUF2959 family protein [candidate division WS5 bacterium]
MKKTVVRFFMLLVFIPLISIILTGCQTVKSTWDSTRAMFGVQKRDIMIGEVKDASEGLEEVRKQFQAAMDKFSTVLNSKEGKLEEKYKTLKSENEKTEKKAGEIQKSIDSVIRVAESMFSEWEAELSQYHSENLRSGSELRMQEAKNQNNEFIKAMTIANEKAAPVLASFSDLVLFSRHNLNSETAEALTIEMDAASEKLSSFFQEIDAAIREADAFVNLLAGSEPAVKQE